MGLTSLFANVPDSGILRLQVKGASGMAEEDSGKGESGGNINATIDAVTGLVKAVPVYQDAVQPAAKELGKSLETVARAVNVALLPLKGIVWSFEKIEKLFIPKVEERLKDVPPEDIITPKANVAGPALEALRYTGDEESLSDMYANLIATAMDKRIASGAHPAFVEIIKQLTPDEAKLLAFLLGPDICPLVTLRAVRDSGGHRDVYVNVSLFGEKAGLEYHDLTSVYLDNLCRLGLTHIPEGTTYSDDRAYAELEASPLVLSLKGEVEKAFNNKCELYRGLVRTTALGKQFGKVCIK